MENKKNVGSDSASKKEASKESFISNMANEAKELEQKIVHLPVNRRTIFLTGCLILLSVVFSITDVAILMAFGVMVLVLIGAGMVYMGLVENNAIAKALLKKAKAKK